MTHAVRLRAVKVIYPPNPSMLEPRQFPLQAVKLVKAPFDGADWLFEIKHDGFRVVAIRDGGPAKLFTRNGNEITRTNAHLVRELKRAAKKTLRARRRTGRARR